MQRAMKTMTAFLRPIRKRRRERKPNISSRGGAGILGIADMSTLARLQQD